MHPVIPNRSRAWLLAMPALLAALPAVAAGGGTTHYTNDRFGFAANIPAGLVEAEPPADDDGRTFRSRDGKVVVAAWAGYNASDETIRSYMAFSFGDCHGGRPSYLTVHRRWAVLSCNTDGGETIYQKSVMRGRGDGAVFTTLRVTYPTAERAIWDAVAVAATRSIVPAVPQ